MGFEKSKRPILAKGVELGAGSEDGGEGAPALKTIIDGGNENLNINANQNNALIVFDSNDAVDFNINDADDSNIPIGWQTEITNIGNGAVAIQPMDDVVVESTVGFNGALGAQRGIMRIVKYAELSYLVSGDLAVANEG